MLVTLLGEQKLSQEKLNVLKLACKFCSLRFNLITAVAASSAVSMKGLKL